MSAGSLSIVAQYYRALYLAKCIRTIPCAEFLEGSLRSSTMMPGARTLSTSPTRTATPWSCYDGNIEPKLIAYESTLEVIRRSKKNYTTRQGSAVLHDREKAGLDGIGTIEPRSNPHLSHQTSVRIRIHLQILLNGHYPGEPEKDTTARRHLGATSPGPRQQWVWWHNPKNPLPPDWCRRKNHRWRRYSLHSPPFPL